MSLYIGNNSNGENVFHITNKQQPEYILKDSIVPSTVFHSSLDYLVYEKFEFTKFSDYCFKVGQDFIDSWNSGRLNHYQYNGYTFSYNVFPYVFVIDGILVPRLFILDASSGFGSYNPYYNIYGQPSPLYSGSPGVVFYQKDLRRDVRQLGNTTYYRTIYLENPEPEYNNIWLHPNAYSSIPQRMYAIKLNFNTLSQIVIDKPGYNKNLPISITNNSLSINGVNLASLKYISSGKINNIDESAQDEAGNKIQFINSTYSGTNASLNTINGDIFVGNKKIFNGSVKNAFLYDTVQTWIVIPTTLYINSNSPSYAEWNTGLYFPTSSFIILCVRLVYQNIIRSSYILQKGGAEVLVEGSRTMYGATKYQTGYIIKSDGYLYYFRRSTGNMGYNDEVSTYNNPGDNIVCLSFK